MSELEKLIKELCPNGVEYKPLGEVAKLTSGSSAPQSASDFSKTGTPFCRTSDVGRVHMSADFDNISDKITDLAAKKMTLMPKGTILIPKSGASTLLNHKVRLNVESYVVSHLAAVIPNKDEINDRYLYYVLTRFDMGELVEDKSYPSVKTSDIAEKIIIPLPPLLVQQEIVRVLDNFTKLTAELTKELTLRKKQYEHYRDMLLSFDDIREADQADNGEGYNNNVIYRKLGQLCLDITSGKNNSRSNGGQYIVYGSTGAIGKCDKYIYSGERLLVARVGANAGYVYAVDGEYDVSDNTLMVAKVSGCDFKFLFHCLRNANLNQYAKGGGQPLITATQLKNIEIPVPPIETQKRIVGILDKFEMLANSLSDGLPAEIEARKKQYEYYRDKLLDFKDVGGGYCLLEKLVQWLPLGEIATEMYRGAGIKRDEVTEEGMPCVRYGEIYTTYDIWFDECVSHTDEDKIPSKKYFENGDILFAITGESVEEIAKSCVYVGNEKCLAGGDIVVMKHKQNPKYLAYALSTTDAQRQKSKGKIKSKVVHASVPSISSIVIPLPPLAIQGWIAEILDKFHSLATDISEGIPAEIEARKKQYEYYRDKLLAFKKLENVV